MASIAWWTIFCTTELFSTVHPAASSSQSAPERVHPRSRTSAQPCTVKDDAGVASVETVLDEIAKLRQLRALELHEGLFRDLPAKLVTHYGPPPCGARRQRPEVGGGKPSSPFPLLQNLLNPGRSTKLVR